MSEQNKIETTEHFEDIIYQSSIEDEGDGNMSLTMTISKTKGNPFTDLVLFIGGGGLGSIEISDNIIDVLDSNSVPDILVHGESFNNQLCKFLNVKILENGLYPPQVGYVLEKVSREIYLFKNKFAGNRWRIENKRYY